MTDTPPALQPEETARKRVFIKSYGCQMNVYDATRMADVLALEGYGETSDMLDADLVILNTCHIREKAAEKVYSELGRIRKLKHRKGLIGKDTLVAVAGCVAQAEGREIILREPIVDLVIGPQAYHRLPELLRQTKAQGQVVDTEFPAESKFERLPMADRATTRSRGVSAFLTIQEGCDKFCTFCVVPYTRGVEVSRPVDRIMREAEALAAAGVRELTLLGQNVNAWHGLGDDGKDWSLAMLLRHLAQMPGIERLRYSTSHPCDMDEALIALHGEVAEIMPALHLPVQSGSDRILKAMNRKHDRADYCAIIDRLRAVRPDLALSSDFIVGFPGETDQDFEATMSLVREINFASAYSFKYSERPGTPAANLTTQIPDAIKTERLAALQALIAEQQTAFNTAMIGRTVAVLFEKAGRNAGQIGGKSPYLQAVHVDGPLSLIGHTADVKITAINANSLAGALVQSDIRRSDSANTTAGIA